MKVTNAVVMAVICGIIGYGLGFWGQREQRAAAETALADATRQIETVRGQLAQSADRAKLGDLLAQFLVIKDVVDAKNFGKAQELSTAWFDAVRAESQRTSTAEFRKALEGALSFRDQVTAALTKTDMSALSQLTGVEDALRVALGFPAARAPQPSAPPAAAGGAASPVTSPAPARP